MTAAEAAFIEESAALMAESGLPPSTGRVFGWLLICDPPHQSAASLAAALSLSAGSVSSAVNLLHKLQIVSRLSLPGDRRHYYRIDPDYERNLLDLRRYQLKRGLELASLGLKLTPGNSRLKSLHHIYAEFDRFMRTLRPL